MSKKTSAHYQREYRKRLREQGLIKKEVWVLPENSKILQSLEKQLRTTKTEEPNAPHNTNGESMNSSSTPIWTTESLCNALKDLPAFNNGNCSIEIIDGLNSSILITMHEYGDLPIYVTIGGFQILAESVLFAASDVRDTAELNEYVLKTHKYLPLSTISIDPDAVHGDHYHMFGALGASSSLADIMQEISTLAENVIQATEAFEEFLKS